MTIRMRPGSRVHVVDEGLLLTGWSSSALVSCSPGVVRVWQAIEPLLAEPVDPDALRSQLPDKAAAVFDTLLAQLTTHDMVTSVPRSTALSPAQQHLEHFAPDVEAAWSAADSAPVTLLGPADRTEPLTALLVDVAMELTSSGVAVFLGSLEEFVAAGSPAVEVAALASGRQILVGEFSERLLRALETLDAAGEPAAISWSLARTLLVERLHRRLASRDEGAAEGGTAMAIDGATARSVPLAPLPQPIRDRAWSAVSPQRAAEPRPAWAPGLGGLLRAPDPGQLVQVPLARQRVSFAGQEYDGTGIDQAQAADDALLAAARGAVGSSFVAAAREGGTFAAAGRDGIDLLADAVGRGLALLAASSGAPSEAVTPAGALANRWLLSAARLARKPVRLRVTPAPLCTDVVLAVAWADTEPAWGYGTDAEQAMEHALRGLLKNLVLATPGGHPVPVAHDASIAEPLLRAVVGDAWSDALPELAAEVARALPALRCQPIDLGPEFDDAGLVAASAAVTPTSEVPE